jgi:hypothetical protein
MVPGTSGVPLIRSVQGCVALSADPAMASTKRGA